MGSGDQLKRLLAANVSAFSLSNQRTQSTAYKTLLTLKQADDFTSFEVFDHHFTLGPICKQQFTLPNNSLLACLGTQRCRRR